MLHIENISADVLDISEQFVSKIVELSAENADEVMNLRQTVIKHIAAYLGDDSLCGYDISKRLLLQSWADHYPEASSDDEYAKSVWHLVMRYALTEPFNIVLRSLDLTGNTSCSSQQMGRDRNDLIRVLTAYCAHFRKHGTFDGFDSSNHLLSSGRLSNHADAANNILLQQVAVHVLTRGKKTATADVGVVDHPQEHIFHIISKAHACRQSLVEGLSSAFTTPIVPALNIVAVENSDTQISSFTDFDLSASKKVAP